MVKGIIDWNKYIQYDKFISTHGIELSYKWEFNRLENEISDKELILTAIHSIKLGYELVTIHTVHPKELENISAIYYPKTNILDMGNVGELDDHDFVIYDDVITTGKSILDCIEKVGFEPFCIVCLIDRRWESKQNYLGNRNVIIIYDIMERIKNNGKKEA